LPGKIEFFYPDPRSLRFHIRLTPLDRSDQLPVRVTISPRVFFIRMMGEQSQEDGSRIEVFRRPGDDSEKPNRCTDNDG